MFSIIMPYYKNLNVVERSIESVLKQSYKEYELLIVDDGSEDDINLLVSRYSDNRIRIIHQSNTGVSGARNRGISESKFEWICFLDSDDTWESFHLETLYSLISYYSDIFIFATSYRRTGNNVFYSNAKLPSTYPENFVCNNLIEQVLKYGQLLHTNSMCINKRVIKQCGDFVMGCSRGEDTDLWYRCTMYNSIVVSKSITTEYHRDASYLTKSIKKIVEWPFCHRSDILDEKYIPIEKKEAMREMILKEKLSNCKHLIAEGLKNEAILIYKDLPQDIPPRLAKSKRQVELLIKLPYGISKFVSKQFFKLKERSY